MPLRFGRYSFRWTCIPFGMRLRFCDFRRPKPPPPSPLQVERRFRMAQRAIRFSETTDKGVQEATRKRGFSSATAFIRHSVEQELSGRSDELVGAEERLAASIEQVRREVFRLGRTQQALFAFVDSLAKVLADVRSRARRRGDGSRRREGARPTRPVAQERGPSDGRRLAGGDAGFGEPWRRMTNASSGFDRGSRLPGTNARLGRQPTRS